MALILVRSRLLSPAPYNRQSYLMLATSITRPYTII